MPVAIANIEKNGVYISNQWNGFFLLTNTFFGTKTNLAFFA